MKLKQVPLDSIQRLFKNTLMETLSIRCVEIGEDYILAEMPVNKNVHQPMGILHGGASAAMIESIGSMGSVLLIDTEKEAPVGIEINANHISSMSEGTLRAIGKIIHAGKKTHVWQVDLFDKERNKLICTGRLTIMIIPKK